MKPSRLIYWDSNIFIAWLKDEKRPPGEMDGVVECVGLVEAGRVRLITSVVTITEVLDANLPPEIRERYALLMKRRNVQTAGNDLRVSELARDIRGFYQASGDGKRIPTSIDAIHLATAILYRADAFYTFDKGEKGGRSLLALDGNVAGHPLRVCLPEVTQLRLPFGSN